MNNENKRKWTIMVYLAGDNNLSSEMVYALMEMRNAKVGPDQEVAVVAQFDPQGDGIPTQRYIINQGSGFSSLADDALLANEQAKALDFKILPQMMKIVAAMPDELPALAQTVTNDPSRFKSLLELSSKEKETLLPAVKNLSLTDDTGNPWTLLRFLFWSVNEFPAEHYMVVLSGHGSGSDGDFLNDDSSGGSLTVRGLSEVLKVFRKKLTKPLDILGLDTCLMSMAEVYYQIGESVDFLIGSEGVAPNTGWPYREILELFTNPKSAAPSPENYARGIVDEYKRFYMNYALGGVSADIAACKTTGEDQLATLKERVLLLSGELISQLNNPTTRQAVSEALLIAHWTAQTYKFDQYVDLRDFCEELVRKNLTGIRDLAQNVVNLIRENIVLAAASVGPLFQYSYGLSVYFPWAQLSKEYKNLGFASDTRWAEFLELHVETTSRREPRCQCASSGSEVLDAIFNPEPVRRGIPRVSPVEAGRDGDGCKHSSTRFTAPCDRGPGVRFSSVKNPPIAWCSGRPEEPMAQATGNSGSEPAAE